MNLRQRVANLLQKMNIAAPPVPVDEIATRLGISILPLPASSDISGAILRKGGMVTIAVNPAHHIHRQRFTIAHELGHYFLDHKLEQHVDLDFRVAWRNSESSTGEKALEIEANQFAAELLMPTEFLREDLDHEDEISTDILRKLARQYRVSPQAMQLRLSNLGALAPF